MKRRTRDLSLRNAQLAASQHQLIAASRVARRGRARGGAGPAGRQRRPSGGHAAEPRLRLCADDPRRSQDRRADPLAIADRRCADPAGHARAADDARPRAAPSDSNRGPSRTSSSACGRSPSRACHAHDIRLQISVAEDLPPVRADATQLEMALLNLVTNALDAMPDGGTLSITAVARPESSAWRWPTRARDPAGGSWTICSIPG